jgi:hypothetical protein
MGARRRVFGIGIHYAIMRPPLILLRNKEMATRVPAKTKKRRTGTGKAKKK